jgi:hypothetical protein
LTNIASFAGVLILKNDIGKINLAVTVGGPQGVCLFVVLGPPV